MIMNNLIEQTNCNIMVIRKHRKKNDYTLEKKTCYDHFIRTVRHSEKGRFVSPKRNTI